VHIFPYGGSARTFGTVVAVSPQIAIRPAEPSDVALIYRLIVELATYEKAPEHVVGTEAMLAHELFGPAPSVEALIAELDGRAVGYALFYRTFSSWECAPGIWLEDLYVPPEHRRGGIGGALLAELAQITMERGYTRLEWTALHWNTPALDFYAKIGATRMHEWQNHRLARDALARVAETAVSPGATAR